jgi:TIR domain
MPSVFISYRREDSPTNTRLLYDRLRGWFRESDVFMDMQEIRVGVDWLAVLKDKIHACDVLIALIGPGWLATRDSSGLRRLDDQQDFVRYEIAQALRQSKRVIPVLVDGAMLSAGNQLPDDIAALAGLQALTIAHGVRPRARHRGCDVVPRMDCAVRFSHSR